MLSELRIHDLALVEDLILPVAPGLTVLTGETGAGKSLLAAAVAALAGGEVAKEQVRAGSDEAWVEGVFDLADRPDLREAVAAAGVPLAGDGLLVVRREIRRAGRNRVLLNGLTTSLAVLQRLGPALVTVHSQDAQRRLDRPSFYRDLLDGLGGCRPLRERVAGAWRRWQEADAALAEWRRRRETAREQADLWRYQLRELEEADLRPGEEEELRERAAWKRGAVQAAADLAAAWERLGGDEGDLAARLQAAAGLLQRHAGESRRLREIVALLEGSAAQVQEAVLELSRLQEAWDADPAGLDELEERLLLYRRLQEKYDRDVPGLLAWRERLAASLAELETGEERERELAAELAEAVAELQAAAAELRTARRRAAGPVAARLQEAARPLALPHLELRFDLEPRRAGEGPELAADTGGGIVLADGADRVRLLARTNPGEAEGDFREIASGGERSRFLLAAAGLLAAEQPPLLQLFDEIDAGVGADTAGALADALSRVARRSQVICITHLATLAARGVNHWVARKETRGGRTRLRVRAADAAERRKEVARLLGGSAGSEALAERLLAEAAAAHAARGTAEAG